MMTKHKRKRQTDSSTDILGKEPQSSEEFHALANKLIKWARNKDSINIEDFPLSFLISPEIFAEFSNKSEYFAKAYNISRRLIGSRRKQLALKGSINSQIVLATLPLYEPEYKKWLMSLRLKQENVGETKFIIVEIPTWVNKESDLPTPEERKKIVEKAKLEQLHRDTSVDKSGR
jgi:hypothetical protein